jgi:hypothetical protein
MIKPKTSFFTRKYIIRTVVVIIVAYVGVWSYVLVDNHLADRREKHEISKEQALFDNLKPEEKALAKAQNYLKGTINNVQPAQILFLEYLQRRFKLDDSLGVSKTPIPINKNPVIYPQEINFLARIAYPNEIVNEPPKDVIDGIALTNLYSANCDHIAFPNNFWSTMESNYKAGGYYLTHNALAFAFMKDNGCDVPTERSDLLSRTIEGMTVLASDPNTTPDLRYEAIAFLGLSGRGDLIESDWMDKVITEQKEDGSWSNPEDTKNHDHTTVLGMWALLEYSRPNTPHEPLIHRPSGQR